MSQANSCGGNKSNKSSILPARNRTLMLTILVAMVFCFVVIAFNIHDMNIEVAYSLHPNDTTDWAEAVKLGSEIGRNWSVKFEKQLKRGNLLPPPEMPSTTAVPVPPI